jgi:hypothetical protein
MKKDEYFEYRYKLSQDECINEQGELPEYYDEFQMKNMCEYFYSIGYRKAKFDAKETQKKVNEVLGE